MGSVADGIVMNNSDIQKILQELMVRLEDVEVAVQLHKLLYEGIITDAENRARILNDDLYIDATIKSEFLLDQSLLPDTLLPFLSFLQEPLKDFIIIKLMSAIECSIKTLKEIKKLASGLKIETHIKKLEKTSKYYSQMRHQVIAHIEVKSLLANKKYKPLSLERLFTDIEMLSSIFKEISDECGVTIIDLRDSRKNKGIVCGLEALFKIISDFRQCWVNSSTHTDKVDV
ncbi:MAG: hypothetical protein K0R48_533 [Gammaproteobacteria bacterium]|nr:hypothetical protein [Gammaproteobacteria bacterium]